MSSLTCSTSYDLSKNYDNSVFFLYSMRQGFLRLELHQPMPIVLPWQWKLCCRHRVLCLPSRVHRVPMFTRWEGKDSSNDELFKFSMPNRQSPLSNLMSDTCVLPARTV